MLPHLLLAALPQFTPALQLRPDDHIALVGNALAERMQHDGWLEARLQVRFPGHRLSVRNLGFSGDELVTRQRTAGFGTPDEHLTRVEADVVIGFFGWNESFGGEEGLPRFEAELRAYLDHLAASNFSGEGPPRVALVTPIAYEDLGDPHLPEAAEVNARLRPYAEAIVRVAAEKNVPFVDLLGPTQGLYAEHEVPLTINGLHLNCEGNRLVAELIEAQLFGPPPADLARADLEAVRRRVLEKNRLWFQRYRATDGYNVYGGRSSLEYGGVTNYTVLQRELSVLDAACALEDRRLHALLAGEAPEAVHGELPPLIPVETNRPGPLSNGAHPYLSGEEALARMTPAEGLAVELFADEEDFPELVNPVQMSFDTHGRLWVACWPTYPHWRPGEPMNDKLLVLEDTDGDGRADRCTTFAGDLHNPTGFEFWEGGVYVANAPDLLFLEDTDGDLRADRRTRVLHGLSSADTHHAANSFVFGPSGGLYFQEGTFHRSQIETVRGPVRNRDGCVWRYDPRSEAVERYVPYNFANPHGHVFERWGQDFVTDGTGNVNYFALAFNGHLPEPLKHAGIGPFFDQRSRPAGGTEILSSAHFPAESQGNYLVANVIGFQGVFQYALHEAGSGFGAEEVEPLLFSSDPSFRPVDLEVGPDGAVYLLDWHNVLIGHMQHHLRDPSRDAEHGRVYRVRVEGRPLLEPTPIAGRPIEELVALLGEPDARVRYRTRIELSARDSGAVVAAARAAKSSTQDTHQRLELLWLQGQHGVLDAELLGELLECEDARARAAAVRHLRSLRRLAEAPLALLAAAIEDPAPRVRLEALVALSFFPEPRAVELALRTLEHERDRFAEYALEETLRGLEAVWREALREGAPLAEGHLAGQRHLLSRLSTPKLLDARDGPAKAYTLLERHGVDAEVLRQQAAALADSEGTRVEDELVRAARRADAREDGHADHLLIELFAALRAGPPEALPLAPLEELARSGRRAATRCLATAARVEATGDLSPAWREAHSSPAALAELLRALPYLSAPSLREAAFPHVLPLLDGLPNELAAAGGPPDATRARFVRIELPGEARTLTLAEVEVISNGENVAPRGQATQSTVAWGGVPVRAIDGNRSGAFGDGGQTHTIEDLPDPWWELDLGRATPIDAVRVWNRTESGGRFASRLEGFVLDLFDEEHRSVYRSAPQVAPAPSLALEVLPPALAVRRAAVGALVGLGVRRAEALEALVARLDDAELRGAIVAGLREVGVASLGDALRVELAEGLGRVLSAGAEAPELLVLVDELLPHLERETALALYELRRAAGPQVHLLRPVRDALLYDRRELVVEAGREVELIFENTDLMPHNLVLSAPGTLAEVGLAGEAMAAEPDGWERGFVPELEVVWAHTGLLQPGQRETLRFTAPSEPGDYPYVCTFPGHWIRMNGVLRVVSELPPVTELPSESEPVASEGGRAFVRNWTVDELVTSLVGVDSADPDRGRRVLEEATCLACHTAGGAGGKTGPPLEEVVGCYEREELLRQILEPSAVIRAGYEAHVFVRDDGTLAAGIVVEEDAENLYVLDDPYREDLLVLPRAEVESRRESEVSTMPGGLLTTFERDEILALLAYLESLAPDED